MDNRTIQLRLGVGACVAAAVLVLYAIPTFVSTPSNVPNIILSPLFWPYALAGLMGLVGIGLLASGFAMAGGGPVDEPLPDRVPGLMRLLAMAVIMAATLWLLPRLGMVLTSALAFLATSFLMRTRHPIAAVASAIFVPLVLYAFFAHVAHIAIPQGEFLLLP